MKTELLQTRPFFFLVKCESGEDYLRRLCGDSSSKHLCKNGCTVLGSRFQHCLENSNVSGAFQKRHSRLGYEFIPLHQKHQRAGSDDWSKWLRIESCILIRIYKMTCQISVNGSVNNLQAGVWDIVDKTFEFISHTAKFVECAFT